MILEASAQAINDRSQLLPEAINDRQLSQDFVFNNIIYINNFVSNYDYHDYYDDYAYYYYCY